MRTATEIVEYLLGGPPTIAPPKPGTRPTTAPPRPRPGTRPWNPSIRPGVNPRPKARKDDQNFAEANASVPVPPAASDETDTGPMPNSLPTNKLVKNDCGMHWGKGGPCSKCEGERKRLANPRYRRGLQHGGTPWSAVRGQAGPPNHGRQ